MKKSQGRAVRTLLPEEVSLYRADQAAASYYEHRIRASDGGIL